MALKVYGVSGRTTALLRIPTKGGRAWIEVEFKRGRLGLGASNKAATFCTNDKTVQSIIEDSSLFGNTIKLLRIYNSDSDAEPAAPKAAEKPAENPVEVISVPEVNSKEEAISYLKGRGAKATNLKDDDSIRKFMAKIGVEFPNFTI